MKVEGKRGVGFLEFDRARPRHSLEQSKKVISAMALARGINPELGELHWLRGDERKITDAFELMDQGDPLFIPSMGVFEDDIQLCQWQLEKIVSKGVVLVVAELGGQTFDINVWRQFVLPFKALSERIVDATNREFEAQRKAKDDIEYFTRQYSERIITLLARKGISLADLMEDKAKEDAQRTETDIPFPEEPDNGKAMGQQIRAKRTELGISQERAGSLPRKFGLGDAITKDGVSLIERGERSTGGMELLVALDKELRQRRNPAEGNPHLVPGDSPTPMRAM